MSFSTILRRAGLYAAKNSHKILTTCGVLGFFGTVAVAIKVSPTAKMAVDDLRDKYEDLYKKGEVDSPDVPKMEIVKTVTPMYLPVVVMGATSTACIIGGASVLSRKNAALASLYSASQLTLAEYQEKVIKTIGQNKEKEVREAIIQDHIDKHPPVPSQVIVTGRGKTLIYDRLIDRYFEYDIEKLKQAELDINSRMIYGMEMSASLNDVYDKLGLASVGIGEYTGFNIDNQLHFELSAHMTDDNVPCIAITFNPPPSENFRFKI